MQKKERKDRGGTVEGEEGKGRGNKGRKTRGGIVEGRKKEEGDEKNVGERGEG